MPIFQTNGRFEVVAWSPGHGGLLLRSRPVEALAPEMPYERIEVWFKPADLVCLPVYLHGLTIEEADDETTTDAEHVLGRGLHPWENAYLVTTDEGVRGWVIGGSVNGRTDSGPFDATRMFDGWGTREGVQTLFSHGGS